MHVTNGTETKGLEGARELSLVQADRMRVNKANRYGLVLDCRSCGSTWSNTPDKSGDLRRDFWVCPLRCNL